MIAKPRPHFIRIGGRVESLWEGGAKFQEFSY